MPEPVRPELQTDGASETAHIVRVRRGAQVQVSRVPAQVRVQLQHEEAHQPGAQGRQEGRLTGDALMTGVSSPVPPTDRLITPGPPVAAVSIVPFDMSL